MHNLLERNLKLQVANVCIRSDQINVLHVKNFLPSNSFPFIHDEYDSRF